MVESVALEVTVNTELLAQRTGKRAPCTFYVRGCCRFGDGCRHSHDVKQWGSGDSEEEERVFDEIEGHTEHGEKEEEGCEDDFSAKEAALDEEERIQV